MNVVRGLSPRNARSGATSCGAANFGATRIGGMAPPGVCAVRHVHVECDHFAERPGGAAGVGLLA